MSDIKLDSPPYIGGIDSPPASERVYGDASPYIGGVATPLRQVPSLRQERVFQETVA